MRGTIEKIGTGTINNRKFEAMTDSTAQHLAEYRDPLELHVQTRLVLNEGHFPGPSFLFEGSPDPDSLHIEIPENELRIVGFNFKEGDENVWCGGIRMESGSGNEIIATLSEIK